MQNNPNSPKTDSSRLLKGGIRLLAALLQQEIKDSEAQKAIIKQLRRDIIKAAADSYSKE